MASDDDLPTWTVRPALEPAAVETLRPAEEVKELPQRRFRSVPVGLIITVVTVGGLSIAFLATQTGPAENAQADSATETGQDFANSDDPPDALAFESESTTTTTAESTSVEPNPVPLPGSSSEEHISTLSDGVFYLRGNQPSAKQASEIETALVDVFGPESVVNEYTIVAESQNLSADPLPIVVENKELFESASTDITQDFEPVVAMGLQVLIQVPESSIGVIGYTDSQGEEDKNLELSQRRVDIILDYWSANGINPARLSGDGKGEAEPIANNETAEGRQQNRRVEFVISGLVN